MIDLMEALKQSVASSRAARTKSLMAAEVAKSNAKKQATKRRSKTG